MARTIQDLAKEMSAQFTGDKRTDGKEFRKLKDGYPLWMQEVCHQAHGDMMPDDWRYVFIEESVDAIAETDGRHTIEDARGEIGASIYTHELTDWLGSRADRHGYCNEAAEDNGEGYTDIIAMMQAGQLREKDEVFGLVVEALQKIVDDEQEREDESEDDEPIEWERNHECLACKHEWKAPITLSSSTPNISGESTPFCPSCGSKNVMSSAARIKMDDDSPDNAE